MAPRIPPKRVFDVTSIIGLPMAIGLVLLGQYLEGGSPSSILQGTAAVIVFGGTLGAVLISFPRADIKAAALSVRRVFVEETESDDITIGAILRYAKLARKDGILALEDESANAKDPLLRKGLMLAVDGVNPKTLREMLEIDLAGAEERDLQPARVFEAAGGYAPTVGIIGAVLGLIHVMESLSDPSRLGAGIAVGVRGDGVRRRRRELDSPADGEQVARSRSRGRSTTDSDLRGGSRHPGRAEPQADRPEAQRLHRKGRTIADGERTGRVMNRGATHAVVMER